MERKVVIAGGSGFLGQSLSAFLIEKGYKITIISRNPAKMVNGIRYVQWDGLHLDDWASEVDGSYTLVNFTGKSVNCIYTKKNKEEIISSRINSVHALQQAVLNSKMPPKVFVQAGSLAIFGNTKELCDEYSPHGDGFSAEVCKLWEEAFFQQELTNTRQVLLRIGFALGKNGGALEPLQRLAQYNLGGTIGSGEQYISWLHIDDLNEMILWAIENDEMRGIYNATGPNPVTNKVFMRTLRDVMGKGWSPPVPAPFVWLGAYLIMRTDPSLALSGRKCIPKRLIDAGFTFKYTDLKDALKDLMD
jgi:hypothetical protein